MKRQSSVPVHLLTFNGTPALAVAVREFIKQKQKSNFYKYIQRIINLESPKKAMLKLYR